MKDTSQTLIALLTVLWLAVTATAQTLPATQQAESIARKPRLAALPPMGFNTWNAFRKQLDEKTLRDQVDALVDMGFRDAGYEYFIIDGGWKTTSRDPQGNLVPDPAKFPSGMKAFADYVHSRGLKFGLHQPAGIRDCGKDEPGSQYHEEQDAALFASWGLDFVKYDLCDYIHDPSRLPPAPDIDKITLRQGSQKVFDVEAEAVWNHLTGLTRVEDRALCSGGKCVVGIGFDNGAIEFPVHVKDAGHYTLDVAYAVPYFGQSSGRYHQMTLFVSANGGDKHRLDVPYDLKKRYATASVSTELDLKAGDNAILIDNPLSQEEDVRLSYIKMATALNRTGRPMIFSTSGASRPWLWARPIAHMWRTSGDIADRWPNSILGTLDRHEAVLEWGEPGFWPDPDMLVVGLRDAPPPGTNRPAETTDAEYQSQFSLWAIMNAPLFISVDLRHLDETSKRVLLNRNVIAINQDPLGQTGRLIRDQGNVQVFAKRVAHGGAVAILNRGSESASVTLAAPELNLAKPPHQARNLWTGAVLPFGAQVTLSVPRHEVALLRVE